MGKVRVPWNQTSVTVNGLTGNTQFFLTVSAFNTAGTGPFLPAINVTTKKPRKLEHPAEIFDIVSALLRIPRSVLRSWLSFLEILSIIILTLCSACTATVEYWMDLNWLSAVSLLGTSDSNRIRVRSQGLPGEWYSTSELHSVYE